MCLRFVSFLYIAISLLHLEGRVNALHTYEMIISKPSNTNTETSVCYGADIASFWWCSGYEEAGYSCNEDKTQCAASECFSTCDQCSVRHDNAVLDPATGQCCESLSESGTCVNPLESKGPFNPTYGYPNGMGALIVEGPFDYKNGPRIWPNYEDGANGWTSIAPSNIAKDEDCPKIPDELVELGLDPSKYKDLIPISLEQHGAQASFCEISCNTTLIELTGMDPCQFGTYQIEDTSTGQKVDAKMQCFSGGETWLGEPGLGLCGYPCRMVNYTLPVTTYCSTTASSSAVQNECFIECDPRKWPKEEKSSFKGGFQKAYLRID